MAKSKYGAYSGVHDTPAGSKVEIWYADGAECHALWNGPNRYPIGHILYRKIGWYWAPVNIHGETLKRHCAEGPHTSSRRAYHNAMLRNQPRRKAS